MKDTHSNLWGGADKLRESRGSLYPPIHVHFIENKLVVTDFYNPEMKPELPIVLGDIITKINGKAVSEIVTEQLPYYPASNKPSQLRDLARNILMSNDDTLQITIREGASEREISLPLFDKDSLNLYHWYPQPEGKSYKLLDGNIGYVTLANITDEDPKAIASEFKNAKGLIIDIRNYPSAFMPFKIGQFIAPKDTEFVKFTTMNFNNPGEFNFGSPLSIGSNKTKNKFEGPVVVLLNELSQSQAEYTAMAFRAAPNTTIVGSTTAGADGNISPIVLPGGLRTMISGIGVYYPDGTQTQRVGIVPDVKVTPTIKGIKEGRDELLEKAIEIIEQKAK
jgi:C-terminal processing protease CtpA/Prc